MALTGQVNVTSTLNGNFQDFDITGTPSWVTLTGEHTNAVGVIAQRNNTLQQRSGSLTFTQQGSNNTFSVAVNQAAGSYTAMQIWKSAQNKYYKWLNYDGYNNNYLFLPISDIVNIWPFATLHDDGYLILAADSIGYGDILKILVQPFSSLIRINTSMNGTIEYYLRLAIDTIAPSSTNEYFSVGDEIATVSGEIHTTDMFDVQFPNQIEHTIVNYNTGVLYLYFYIYVQFSSNRNVADNSYFRNEQAGQLGFELSTIM